MHFVCIEKLGVHGQLFTWCMNFIKDVEGVYTSSTMYVHQLLTPQCMHLGVYGLSFQPMMAYSFQRLCYATLLVTAENTPHILLLGHRRITNKSLVIFFAVRVFVIIYLVCCVLCAV